MKIRGCCLFQHFFFVDDLEQPRKTAKFFHQVNLNTEIQIRDFGILNKSDDLCTLIFSTKLICAIMCAIIKVLCVAEFVTWHENCAGRRGALMLWAVRLWSLGSAQPICTALVVGYQPNHWMTNECNAPIALVFCRQDNDNHRVKNERSEQITSDPNK